MEHHIIVCVFYVINRFCLEFANMLGGVVDEVGHYTAPGEKMVDKVVMSQ